MPLLYLILGLMLCAALLYGFDTLIPTTESNKPIKFLIYFVVLVGVVVTLIQIVNGGLGSTALFPLHGGLTR